LSYRYPNLSKPPKARVHFSWVTSAVGHRKRAQAAVERALHLAGEAKAKFAELYVPVAAEAAREGGVAV
jgi:hypothetical protein